MATNIGLIASGDEALNNLVERITSQVYSKSTNTQSRTKVTLTTSALGIADMDLTDAMTNY